tara:strand:+ start:6467 stop:6730 length:264 start_codon:yes stop_codon:yes gene_type:complete
MIELAKKDLKKRIIAENSEEFYYKLIAEKTKKFHEFKKAGDFVFGKNDKQFRDEIIKTTLQINSELEQEEQLYELVLVEIALDVFMG